MRLTLVLLLTLSLTATTMAAGYRQDAGDEPSPLKHLTLTFELQDLPGLKAAGSFWEVSYQWRIADKKEFDRWSREGENLARQNSVGVVLSKKSFVHYNLSDQANRRFSLSVKVDGELRKRLQNAGRQPVIVWLDANVRIHDGELGTDIITRVNPAWGPNFYRTGSANVRMNLTKSGTLRWTTKDVPPWTSGTQEARSSGQP
jgi:hypothetical protein